MNRRTFLAASVAPLAYQPIRNRQSRQRPTFRRMVFRGGKIVDGTGRPAFVGDVLVEGDRVLAIDNRIEIEDADILSCEGHAVSPGFVDIHGHSDTRVFVNRNAESKIRQGVTTDVGGQDGDSMGPWKQEDANNFSRRFETQHNADLMFDRIGGYLAALDGRPASINIATMVGTGTIRDFVIGNADRPANPVEIKSMVALVEEALEQGACGLSSGLEYVPGAFADSAELVELCRPLADAGLPYASHMRNEDDRLVAAIEEALFVGMESGAPVQIAHLKMQGQRNWWKAPVVLRMLETARATGIDVMYDRYPYVAFSTGLTNLFPIWSRDGGNDAFLKRLDDTSLASRIEATVHDKVSQLGSWNSIQITSTANKSLSWAQGRRLGTLADERGVDPYALLLLLIREDAARTSMVGFGMGEENTEALLAHPLGMICSDGSALATYGPLAEGTPHPRSYGTFPRVLGHYCRDRKVMSLESAIQKMTSQPAKRMKLADRGVLKPGAFADLVVFDPATVKDNATFAEPHQYPSGIRDVFVNGTPVLLDGEHTGATPGRALRPSS